MRPWAIIARKEIKEQLRSRRTFLTLVIVPFLVWVGVGLMHAFLFGSMTPEGPLAAPMDMHLTLLDPEDGNGTFGFLARDIIMSIAANLSVNVHEVSYEEGMKLVEEGETVLYVLIPEDFTENLTSYGFGTIKMWIDPTSPRASTVASAIEAGLSILEQRRYEIRADMRAIRAVPFTFLMLSFMLIFSAMWGPMPVITTSFAGEREKKTLEVLLATPVKRTSILLGKLLAAGFAAAIYMGSSIAGMGVYNWLMAWATAGALAGAESMVLTPEQAAVVIASALLTVLLSASLGIVISCFARTTRDAESYYSALFTLPMMLIAGTAMMRFEDLPLALQAIILAIPFSHGVLMINNSLIYGKPWPVIAASALYMLAWAIGALLVGAKLFEREEIVETRKVRHRKKRIGLLARLRRRS
ncbi:MAG TPA: ABC transporter permease [Candidatus Bathyarchaeota archaeon]|nr:ABC transporter permease [Candidatus Bathyarchaeota archaeon]